jgi:hypothetical protein
MALCQRWLLRKGGMMPPKSGRSGQHKKGAIPGPKSEEERAEAQTAFLAAFAETGTVTHGAKSSGISRQTHYNWLTDAGYSERFSDAQEQATDNLEREARRRAVEGVEEPVYYQGEVVGKIRKMSDTLLIFLLKGARPDKYRERLEHTGHGGGPLGQVTFYELPKNGREATPTR